MTWNSYAIVLAFFALLRCTLGLFVIGAAAGTYWRSSRRYDDQLSGRGYLLLLLILVLIGMSVASWPLLYLVLQSYVDEIPGVMCVYGVTRLGEGSLGGGRHLPDILSALQIGKPIVVLLGGGWFALYLLNRRTNTSPLLSRLFLFAIPLGALIAVEAGTELTYLLVPKTEQRAAAGCCTVERVGDPFALTSDESKHRLWLIVAFFGGTGALVALLHSFSRGEARRSTLGLLSLYAVIMTSLGGLFLIHEAAPILLRLPYHHCAYDLLPRVPEAIVAAAIFLAGGCLIVWAWMLRCLGAHPEAATPAAGMIRTLLRCAMWCYLASVGMLTFELFLAI